MNLQSLGAATGTHLPMARLQSCGQLLLQRGDITQGAVIGSFRALLGDIGRGDNMNLPPQVIESQDAIEEHELAIGQRKIIGSVLPDILQMANYIVGKVPNCSSCEGGQSWDYSRPMLPQQFLQEREYVAGPALPPLAPL